MPGQILFLDSFQILKWNKMNCVLIIAIFPCNARFSDRIYWKIVRLNIFLPHELFLAVLDRKWFFLHPLAQSHGIYKHFSRSVFWLDPHVCPYKMRAHCYSSNNSQYFLVFKQEKIKTTHNNYWIFFAQLDNWFHIPSYIQCSQLCLIAITTTLKCISQIC